MSSSISAPEEAGLLAAKAGSRVALKNWGRFPTVMHRSDTRSVGGLPQEIGPAARNIHLQHGSGPAAILITEGYRGMMITHQDEALARFTNLLSRQGGLPDTGDVAD